MIEKTYNLDSSTCIDVIRNKTPEARSSFEQTRMGGHEVVISSVVLHELTYGARISSDPKASQAALKEFLMGITVVEFDADDALQAGEIRAVLSKKGKTIGPFDVLIAGQALRRQHTLVTANTKEFSRVSGLIVENWRRSKQA